MLGYVLHHASISPRSQGEAGGEQVEAAATEAAKDKEEPSSKPVQELALPQGELLMAAMSKDPNLAPWLTPTQSQCFIAFMTTMFKDQFVIQDMAKQLGAPQAAASTGLSVKPA